MNMLMDAVDTDQVKQYVFISTISVYASFAQAGITEGSPLAQMDEDPDSEDTGKWYGALKVRCEEQAEKAMPGRVTKVRCGLIIGPGDKTDRFTYWPVTAAKSDEMLAPGSGDDPLQTIDVRDLADWAWWLTLPEERTAKLKTGLSPERQAEILEAWHESQTSGVS